MLGHLDLHTLAASGRCISSDNPSVDIDKDFLKSGIHAFHELHGASICFVLLSQVGKE